MSALVRLRASGPVAKPKDGRVFTPLATWIADAANERPRSVFMAPTDDPNALQGQIALLDSIAVDFPKPTDGRGFSIAILLRSRVGWRSELRAVGAVALDQLAFMARCGFDAFDLRDGEDVEACLGAFNEISVRYQGAIDEPRPLFRRRADALASLERGS